MKLFGIFGAKSKESSPAALPPTLVDLVVVKTNGEVLLDRALVSLGQAVLHNLNVATWPPKIQPESQGKLLGELFTEEAGFAGFAVGHLAYGATNLNLQTYVEPNLNLLGNPEEGEPPRPPLDYSNVSLHERSILELLASAGREDLVKLRRLKIGAFKPLKGGYGFRYRERIRDEFGSYFGYTVPDPHPFLLEDLSPQT